MIWSCISSLIPIAYALHLFFGKFQRFKVPSFVQTKSTMMKMTCPKWSYDLLVGQCLLNCSFWNTFSTQTIHSCDLVELTQLLLSAWPPSWSNLVNLQDIKGEHLVYLFFNLHLSIKWWHTQLSCTAWNEDKFPISLIIGVLNFISTISTSN